MDRIALSKRLEGLSSVFADNTYIKTDLSAMSHVLANMDDEKFSQILNPEFDADKPVEASEAGVETPVEERAMEASDNNGGYWNREASTAVINNLLRDVVGMDKTVCCDTGRHITKEQTPDGHKAAEKPSTLKTEQTPDIAKSLKSGIVEKSHGKVRKEAGQNADLNKSKNIPAPGTVDKLIKSQEGMPKAASKDSCDDKKEAKVEEKEATMIESEGIELSPTMEEVSLTKEDEARLGQLFA